ncbi:MAG: tRNA pseudouridine(38-40) synthase TruA [Bacteroidales bacterium]|nr:tRNA pseudouridine(38-40) synthase TruA [Bacteroidales bacterium]
MRYFLHMAYNGRNYYGWQVQPDRPTVQELMENCLSALFREKIAVTGAGRTDTGVHAADFYAHFDTETPLLEEKRQWLHRINAFLPEDIAVYDILPVRPEAHARFDALSRTYRYRIHTAKQPFFTEYSYRLYFQPDFEAMNRCAALLGKYRDFTSFSKAHTQTKTNNCVISHAEWHEDESGWFFEITADRFLRNMVRAIVGTLLEVGRGKLDEEGFCRLIEAKDRCQAGTSVPAHALSLVRITYPENIFLP